jgi:ABC-2 type transport system ATP-binding protein
MSKTPVISAQHLVKNFGNFRAVDDISFEVMPGSICGFLGPNGSGKSTTLRMMTDLIRPDSGEILWFGESLKSHRSSIMNRIGCIIEKPDFYTYLSALENLQLLGRASGCRKTKADYDELLQLVGLKGREKDAVKAYSHGMKQRLGLAQALLHEPEVVILDEPNTGLDPQGIIDLREVILQLNREKGITFLFSSHILNEVQEICTDLIVIHKGKMVVQGPTTELLSQQKLRVSIELPEKPDTAPSWLGTTFFTERHAVLDGRYLDLQMSKEEIPLLLENLQKVGQSFYRIDYRNQLEKYFLEITNQ